MAGAYTGNLSRVYQVDQAAPLGRNRPGQHLVEDEPLDRDDAPLGGGWQPDPWSREDFLLAVSPAPPRGAAEQGHNVPTTHEGVEGSDKPASPFLAWAGTETGPRHPPAPARGMGPAAHGGLRGDSDQPWANPDGFGLGHDHDMNDTERYMGKHLTNGAIRPVQEPYIETGQAESPPTGLGRFTSIFDPSRDGKPQGTARPTLRRVLRPYGSGDYVTADEQPQTSSDLAPGIGQGWVL